MAFPKPFPYGHGINPAVRTPGCTHPGLGSSAFARRYLRNRCFFLFLRLLRCFSSPGSLPYVMDSRTSDGGLLRRVSPFRYLRIDGYLLLPEAFRSLSRLSSALSAKASTLRSCSLILFAYIALYALLVLAFLLHFIHPACPAAARTYPRMSCDEFIPKFIGYFSVCGFQGTKCLKGFLAATCSPTPSPAQYHRPLRS